MNDRVPLRTVRQMAIPRSPNSADLRRSLFGEGGSCYRVQRISSKVDAMVPDGEGSARRGTDYPIRASVERFDLYSLGDSDGTVEPGYEDDDVEDGGFDWKSPDFTKIPPGIFLGALMRADFP